MQRSAGSAGTVMVLYNTATARPRAGETIAAASGTLTFANGEIVKTVTVTILPDTLVEGNETFTLTLSGQTGGATLGVAAATVTIVDNDSAGGGLDSGCIGAGIAEAAVNARPCRPTGRCWSPVPSPPTTAWRAAGRRGLNEAGTLDATFRCLPCT